MISLIDSNHTLQYKQAAAHTSVDGTGYVAWHDIPNGPAVGNDELPLPGSAPFTTNGTSVVTICPAPPKGFRRIIDLILLNNTDTGSITPLFQLFDGTNTSVIFTGTRATLEQLMYMSGGSGWQGYSVALARQ